MFCECRELHQHERERHITDLVPHWDQLPDLSWKERVSYLTYQFLKLPQIETPVDHLFGNGMYIRTMRIPAHTLFLGRAHRYGHECSLLEGSVIWITPSGRKQVDARFTVHTSPGSHMVFYALTDVVGQTVHHNKTDSRDVDFLENDIFESVESLTTLGAQVHERLEQVCLV